MKKYFVVLVLFFLSGCVSIEAPENLVSDTVEASKDAYKAIKETITKDDSEKENRIFSYKYVSSVDESYSQSTANCIDGAIDIARKALDIYKVDIAKTLTTKVVEEGKSVFECSIVVKNK